MRGEAGVLLPSLSEHYLVWTSRPLSLHFMNSRPLKEIDLYSENFYRKAAF